MSTIGDRIRAERKRLKLTQQQLADRIKRAGFSMTQGGIAQMERRGETDPKSIVQLAKALRLHPEWLKTESGPKYTSDSPHAAGRQGRGFGEGDEGFDAGPTAASAEARARGSRRSAPSIPMRGEVAAGQWLDIDAEIDARDFVQHPIAPDPAYPREAQYGLVVRGTSMNKVAQDGDIFHCLDIGITAVEPDPEDIVIVERRRHQQGLREVTAKRIKRRGKVITLMPDSSDPRWKPIKLDNSNPPEDEEIAVVAVVLARYQQLRKRNK